MKPIVFISALIISLAMPNAFARDYSYMDDRSSSSTRNSSTSSGQSSGLGSVVDAVVGATVEATMDSVFSEEDKSLIRRYYRGGKNSDSDYSYKDDDDGYKGKNGKKNKHKHKKKKSLPPGLQKKLARGGELPPGWQKKVQRGEVMESDLYNASRPLPYQLRRKLPETEYGAQVREIDGRVVKVLEATGVIIDVFDL